MMDTTIHKKVVEAGALKSLSKLPPANHMDITETFLLRVVMNPNFWEVGKNMRMEVSMKFR
jgi:hypothetical protein